MLKLFEKPAKHGHTEPLQSINKNTRKKQVLLLVECLKKYAT
jgi:hypothetical protein